MRCSICNSPIGSGSKYCGNCGNKISAEDIKQSYSNVDLNRIRSTNETIKTENSNRRNSKTILVIVMIIAAIVVLTVSVNAGGTASRLKNEMTEENGNEQIDSLRPVNYDNKDSNYILTSETAQVLEKIAQNCRDESYDEVFNIISSETFNSVENSFEQIKDRFLYETEYGTIGVYYAPSQKYGKYMIYYGGYREEERHSSKSAWIGYKDGNCIIDIGDWWSDIPDGHHTLRYWNNMLNENVSYRTIDGIVRDGLFDGSCEWTFEEYSTKRSWSITFEKGFLKPIEDTNEEGKWPVSRGFTAAGPIYLVVDETELNHTYGLPGYAQY